jgi:diguanylate cyclase (GGDEF)-like protein
MPWPVLCYRQLSRFGRVNNSVGTQLGDRIISLVARRLVKTFPGALALGRTHGDHFTLCLPSEGAPFAHAEQVLEFLQRPFAVRGEVIVLSVRVGVASPQQATDSASALYHASEVALHRAKQNGRSIVTFDPSMLDDARASHRLENDLRVALVNNAAALHGALANEEFQVYYQPIVDVGSGTIVCFEALLRWMHPERGMISPGEFIPMAEEIRLMDVLGKWVIGRACRDAQGWPAPAGASAPAVSVNLSPTQFLQPALLLAAVDDALAVSGLPAQRLKLEVTESALPVGPLSVTLQKLRDLGCEIALDDFGSGYSSFTQLHQLPLDYLKVDQSFVRGWESVDSREAERFGKLIGSIIGFAKLLGLRPLAEGVESPGQVADLLALGCELIQGFVYARPMPADQVAACLAGGLQGALNHE